MNSKWVKDLILRPKTIKLLQKSRGINVHDFGLGHIFLDTASEVQATKEKIDKLDIIKIKTFCVS